MSLRRSVSTAYYALFHLLVDAAAGRLVSGTDRQPLRNCLTRAFDHGVMKRVARQFAERNLSPRPSPGLNGMALQDQIVRVAAAFVDLQQHRHDADYNLGRQFTRVEALNIVSAAERAFVDWRAVRNSAQADTFLVGLPTFERCVSEESWTGVWATNTRGSGLSCFAPSPRVPGLGPGGAAGSAPSRA